MRARKQVKKMKEEQDDATIEESENVQEHEECYQQKEEDIDIDLDDPEVGAAATKIQAGYKGMRARKQVKQMKEDNESKPRAENLGNDDIIDIGSGRLEDVHILTTHTLLDVHHSLPASAKFNQKLVVMAKK